jgi:hypothetical protein
MKQMHAYIVASRVTGSGRLDIANANKNMRMQFSDDATSLSTASKPPEVKFSG